MLQVEEIANDGLHIAVEKIELLDTPQTRIVGEAESGLECPLVRTLVR